VTTELIVPTINNWILGTPNGKNIYSLKILAKNMKTE
jgi:hypothetical protein